MRITFRGLLSERRDDFVRRVALFDDVPYEPKEDFRVALTRRFR